MAESAKEQGKIAGTGRILTASPSWGLQRPNRVCPAASRRSGPHGRA